MVRCPGNHHTALHLHPLHHTNQRHSDRPGPPPVHRCVHQDPSPPLIYVSKDYWIARVSEAFPEKPPHNAHLRSFIWGLLMQNNSISAEQWFNHFCQHQKCIERHSSRPKDTPPSSYSPNVEISTQKDMAIAPWQYPVLIILFAFALLPLIPHLID